MSSYGTYSVKDKKCATCSFWSGDRTINYSGNKPQYIKAIAGNANCIVTSNRSVSATNTCAKWGLWEKIHF